MREAARLREAVARLREAVAGLRVAVAGLREATAGLREAVAGLREAVLAEPHLCECAPCTEASHHLHLVVCLGSRHVGAACPYVTAHKNVRGSTGGRAATRRHAHSCGRGRGGRQGVKAERLEPR